MPIWDIQKIRDEFPVLAEEAYLASAGTGPMPRRSLKAIQQRMQEGYVVGKWKWAEDQIEDCRRSASQLIGAEPEEIALLKSTTAGINVIASGIDWHKGENIVINDLEYPSNVFPWYHQARQHGLDVRVVQSENAIVPIERLAEQIDSQTRVVAVSHVQFARGYRIDLKRLSQLTQEVGALLFVDAIQSIGALKVNVAELGIDALSAGGYKWICGPIGIGITYLRESLLEEISPAWIGTSSLGKTKWDEFWLGILTGTPSYVKDFGTPSKRAKKFEYTFPDPVLCAGLQESIEYLLEVGQDRIEVRISELVDHLLKRLKEENYEVTSPEEKDSRAGIVNFNPGIKFKSKDDAEQYEKDLFEAGVRVHVRDGGIRVSCHFFNNFEDIERLLRAVRNQHK